MRTINIHVSVFPPVVVVVEACGYIATFIRAEHLSLPLRRRPTLRRSVNSICSDIQKEGSPRGCAATSPPRIDTLDTRFQHARDARAGDGPTRLTTGEIAAHFDDVYGATVSKETISKIPPSTGCREVPSPTRFLPK